MQKSKKTLSNSSVNAIKNVLNNTFKLAIKQNILLVNPMKQIELKNKPATRTVTSLNDDELKVIFKTIPDTHFYIPCMIGLHTGARCGEILALTWDDINFESNTVTFNKSLLYKGKEGVEISTTKTISSIRTIKMTNTLVNALLEWKEKQESNKNFYGEQYYQEQNFVCTHEDGCPINPPHFSTQIARLSKKINIPFNFHQLRHTHATKLIESDVNIKVIQERLGHHSIATTLSVYSHVTRNLEDDAINKFESNLNI